MKASLGERLAGETSLGREAGRSWEARDQLVGCRRVLRARTHAAAPGRGSSNGSDQDRHHAGWRVTRRTPWCDPVRGKALYLGERKLIVKGVTYGPFSSEPDRRIRPGARPTGLRADGRRRHQHGPRSTRTPQRWLLDLAQRHGLQVMVGLPWEQHVAFLDTGAADSDRADRARGGRGRAPGHPAVLCYAVGNEIPAVDRALARTRRVERLPRRLCRGGKRGGPRARSSPTSTSPPPSTCAFLLRLPLLQRLPRAPRGARALPRAAAEPRRRPAAADGRARARQPPQRRGGAGAHAALAARVAALDAGCAGEFVFAWTDAVAPRRPRDPGLGLRPDHPRARAQAGARRRQRARSRPPTPQTRTRPDAARSRWSSAPTTARRRCDECLEGVQRCTIRTTR